MVMILIGRGCVGDKARQGTDGAGKRESNWGMARHGIAVRHYYWSEV